MMEETKKNENFSLPNLAPRRATSNKHKITCFSFFRIIRSSVSNSRHSKICKQFLCECVNGEESEIEMKVNKLEIK